ncbi:MAG TPA: Flp family type IVb pilin [Rhizomicrobium sp.]|nr:Flp family type IVb pilin [Rhizomicrobium sp.]
MADAPGGPSAYSDVAGSALTFWRDARGVTAIEYSLIAGVMALAIVGVITQIGTTVNSMFTSIMAGF